MNPQKAATARAPTGDCCKDGGREISPGSVSAAAGTASNRPQEAADPSVVIVCVYVGHVERISRPPRGA